MVLYGKHALDMIASSQDSLRLAWLVEMFSSAAVADGKEDEEAGISLKVAVGLIRKINPGVRSAKVESRFKELHRVRDRMSAAGAGPVAGVGPRSGAGPGVGVGPRSGAVPGVGVGPGAEASTKVPGTGVKGNRRGGKEERVTKEEFIEVFHDFCTRPEIYFLLVQFSSNKEFLDSKDLMRFLEAEQGVAQVSFYMLCCDLKCC